MQTFPEIVKDIEASSKSVEFLKTGLRPIDDFLDGGFMRKELVVLGAPSGKGKSYVAGNLFYNVAQQGFKSAYFSLEISNAMIASRLIGAMSNIKPTRVIADNALFTPQEYQAIQKSKATIGIHDKFMYFYDDLYVLSEIEKAIKENEYEFIVIDFVQNIMVPHIQDEYARLSFIALSLQKLAKDTNSCILLLSQLSNAVVREQRDDIVEFRGSGTIATVCDLGFFIERNEQIQTNGNQTQNIFTIKLKKNRRGVSGMFWDFAFLQPGGRIIDFKQP